MAGEKRNLLDLRVENLERGLFSFANLIRPHLPPQIREEVDAHMRSIFEAARANGSKIVYSTSYLAGEDAIPIQKLKAGN